jgi:L-lactate utilization protein LutC
MRMQTENNLSTDAPGANPGRERILTRIRAGLRSGTTEDPILNRDGAVFGRVLDRFERFQKECTANLIECYFTRDRDESTAKLAGALQSLPGGEIFIQDAPELRRLIQDATRRLDSEASAGSIRWSSEGAPRERSQATITLAEALIAQTGSVLVSSGCGGRGASIVAPCHIVFATKDQIVDDLRAALKLARERGILESNSFICVISGSSRTADIEKILVQGAHGPRRVVVIVQQG